MMMFLRYQKKHKTQFIVLYTIIILLILGAGFLSIKETGIPPLSVEQKLSVSMGALLIFIIVALALFNVIKIFWRFKSLGFLAAFGILSLLRVVIDVLIKTLLLVSIPLLILDLIVRPYFYYLNMTTYFDDYKLLRFTNEKD